MSPGFNDRFPDVSFNEQGFPIFNKWVHTSDRTNKTFDITIEPTGKRWKDNRAADKAAGITAEYRRENKLIWHHHEETGRMQLIPKELHNVVRHSGGHAVWDKVGT